MRRWVLLQAKVPKQSSQQRRAPGTRVPGTPGGDRGTLRGTPPALLPCPAQPGVGPGPLLPAPLEPAWSLHVLSRICLVLALDACTHDLDLALMHQTTNGGSLAIRIFTSD